MAERKHNSIYGARLREALIKDKPSPLQSEKLPSFRPFYVDRSILEKLHNNSNELVVGRRVQEKRTSWVLSMNLLKLSVQMKCL